MGSDARLHQLLLTVMQTCIEFNGFAQFHNADRNSLTLNYHLRKRNHSSTRMIAIVPKMARSRSSSSQM